MNPVRPAVGFSRALWLAFIGSAACAAIATVWLLRLATGRSSPPVFSAMGVVATLVVVWLVSRMVSHARLLNALRRGQVDEADRLWASQPRKPLADTLRRGLLMAAFGQTVAGRALLELTPVSPAERDLEHMLRALVHGFEGDFTVAREAVSKLQRQEQRGVMELWLRGLERRATVDELIALEVASDSEPLTGWALRYAAAVGRAQLGQREHAVALVRQAPPWPRDSVLHQLHQRIVRPQLV